MKLKLVRFCQTVNFHEHLAWTMQIEDKTLFARVVSSLQSEKGQQADEPYLVLDEKEKVLNPKKALILLDNLPLVPLNGKALLGNLYKKFDSRIQENEEAHNLIQDSFHKINELLQTESLKMWGSYRHNIEWNIIDYMKAFDYEPLVIEGETLIEKCIALFQILADTETKNPVVMVNAKSFFDDDGINILFEQAFFHGIPLLMMESWRCESTYTKEKKIVIDQDLLEY